MLWKNCEGGTRRDCLRLGLAGLIPGGLVGSLAASAGAADRMFSPPAKACILVWMDGGPTHYETFDPKPAAPVEIRGELPEIATSVPGMRFSKHMEGLSKIADQMAIVRSIRHNQGNHGAGNHYMMTGAPPRIPVGCGAYVSFHPSMGSVTAHELSAPAGLPPYFSLPRMTRSGGPNFLGAKFSPFVVAGDPNSRSFRVRDVALPRGITDGRYLGRQALRQSLDRMQRINDHAAGDPLLGVDEFYQQGAELMSSAEAQAAFDIERESEDVRDRYGRNSFGQRALLGRRLVEAGVRFVTLYHGGWDHHVDMFPRLAVKLPPFEQTVAALIVDLAERNMLDETLVVVMGEFGRTPKINKRGGRDHWSNAMSVMVAGGGTPGGQIVGATDRHGFSAVERVLAPENLTSTIYNKLGIDPGKIVYTPQGRPVHLVSDATPITELMG